MTITMSSEAAAVLASDGEVWVAVEGERASVMPASWWGQEPQGPRTLPVEVRPPRDFVDAMRPCLYADDREHDKLCTTCHNGKRVLEVQVPCPHVRCGEPRRSEGMEWTCDHWRTDDLIPVSVTVAECLPIVELADDVPDPIALIELHGLGGVSRWEAGNDEDPIETQITIHGNPEPGQFAVHLLAVKP